MKKTALFSRCFEFTLSLKKLLSKQQQENAQRCYKVMLEIKSIAEILRAAVMPKTMLLAYTPSVNQPSTIQTSKTADSFNSLSLRK